MRISWSDHLLLGNPLSSNWLRNLWAACYAWEGTPYRDGQMAPKVGVDCIRLCSAIASTLSDKPLQEPERLPRDTAFHRPDTARVALRNLMRKFPEWDEVKFAAFVMPGDLIVAGTVEYPFHGLVVHPDKNLLIHAAPQIVEVTSLSSVSSVHHVFRHSQWLK